MDNGIRGTSTGQAPSGDGEGRLHVMPEGRAPSPEWTDGAVLRRVMETRMFGLAVTDASGRVLEANDAFLEMVGYSREDLVQGRIHWEALTPPHHAELTAQALRELHRRGSVAPFEKEYVRRDGRHVPVLIGLSRLDEERHLAVVLELTERRHAESALRFLADASRTLACPRDTPPAILQRVARLATGAVASFCAVDLLQPDGRLRRVAASHRDPEQDALVRQVLRTPHVEGVASLLLEVLHTGTPRLLKDLPPETRQQLALTPEHRKLLDTLDPRSALVVPLKSRKRVLGLLLLGRCEEDASYGEHDLEMAEELARRIVAALDNVRLMDETRRAERRARFLARASRLLALALDVPLALEGVARLCVPVLADWCAVDLLDEDGALHRAAVAHRDGTKAQQVWAMDRRWPAHVEDTFGPGHVVHTGHPELVEEVTPEKLASVARDADFLRAMQALGPHSYVIVPLQARGRTLGALTLVYADSHRRYQFSDVHTATDLAGRIALAVDNARLYRTAQEAVHVRDEFLAVASHELKAPLTPLNLRLQSLQRELEGPAPLDRERVRGHVKVLQRQTKRLSTLVQSLLDVSRIEAGTLQMDLEDVDLSGVVRDVVGRYVGQADRARSPLRVELEGAPHGRWDRLRLEQVVSNLLSNALKYGAGKPVHVRVEERLGRARLTVRDEGIGIAPEHLPRIFGRFERAVESEHFGGLGLGLYITRYLVEALGGTIRVASEPGQGATFEVSLPLPPAD